MDSEILCHFLLGNNEGMFERPRKNSLDGTGESKFLDLFLNMLENISEECKNYGSWSESYAVSEYRLINCVSAFLREGLPTLSKVSKFIWTVNKQGFYQLL